MTSFNTILRNSSYLLGFRLLSRLLTTVFLLYAVSQLGPELFGVFSFALVTLEFMSSIGDLGVTRYGARELVRHWDERTRLLGKIMTLQVGTSLVICLSLFLAILVMNPPYPKLQLLLIAVLTLFLYSVINTTESVFIARQLFFFSALFTFIGRAVYLIIGLTVLATGGSVVYLMWGFFAAVALESVLRLSLTLSRVTSFSFRFPVFEIWRMFRATLPFALAGITSIVSIRVNVMVLEFIDGDTPVGIYNAAFTLFTPFLWIPIILTQTAFPGLADSFTNNPAVAQRQSWQWQRLMAIVGIPAAIGVSLVAKTISGYFSQGFEEITPVLIILMWCLPPALISAMDFIILQVTNEEKAAAAATTFGAISCFVFSIVFIPVFGSSGAALALLATVILRAVYMQYQVKETMEKSVLTIFIKPSIAGAAMILVGLAVRMVNAWMAVAVGLVVYGLVILFTGAVKLSEIRSMIGRPARGVDGQRQSDIR